MDTCFAVDHDKAAQQVIQAVGKKIVIGLPIGLGKPIGFINALYKHVAADPSLHLTIITGLTLARPLLKNSLEKALIEPIMQRLLGDYEDSLYELARMKQQLPINIRVIEFFFSPGKFVHNAYAQQQYISSKYTSVIEDALRLNINVIAQQVVRSKKNKQYYSLSCNSDLYLTLAKKLMKQDSQFAIVAEVNEQLPYMFGDAEVKEKIFTHIVDTKHYQQLFALPQEELAMQDHMIGLYSSCLVKDDSCLQIGIGKMGNAIANALKIRNEFNEDYQKILSDFKIKDKFATALAEIGEQSTFQKGLYASTEMWSDEYLSLIKTNILRKKVYDHLGLQQLLNERLIDETITPNILNILFQHGIISSPLREKDLKFLKKYGIFKSGIKLKDGELILKNKQCISADLFTDPKTMADHCLGDRLVNGKIMHAGFFIGSQNFYNTLKNMPDQIKSMINMTSIARTNQLANAPRLLALQRQYARFINSCMMVTLTGATVSDGLKNNIVVSGVGGQFDFVLMGLQLPGARSIINCRSTRISNGKVQTNIEWDYANITIPRYLRDIIITEYGIADCRSKVDTDVIKAILNITDSRFQSQLLKLAKVHGKLEQDYQIPVQFTQNYPETLQKIFSIWQSKGYFPSYPFGSELTAVENKLKHALLFLKSASVLTICKFFFNSLNKNSGDYQVYLQRMQLAQTKSLSKWIVKRLLIQALAMLDLQKN